MSVVLKHQKYFFPSDQDKDKEKELTVPDDDARNASRTSSRATPAGSRASKMKRRQTKLAKEKTREDLKMTDTLTGKKKRYDVRNFSHVFLLLINKAFC